MPGEDDKTSSGTGTAAATTADDKPAVTFKTREEFHREVDRKAKSEAKKAVEDFQSKFFETLGIESEEDLPKIKETIASSAKTVTEAEKLKSQLDKTTKEHGKAIARGDALQAKLKGIARRDALAPFAGKTVDMDMLSMLADRHLEVDDDGVVTVKEGGKVEDWVESTFKAKPYLRVPVAAAGAGTTATEPRKANDGTTSATTTTAAATTQATGAAATVQNGTPKTPQEWGRLMAQGIKTQREGTGP